MMNKPKKIKMVKSRLLMMKMSGMKLSVEKAGLSSQAYLLENLQRPRKRSERPS